VNTNWTETLSDTDWIFLKRFVLCSGSLKDLAREYDVSYPTIRLRLDRFIQKIQVHESMEQSGIFERTLRVQYADGQINRDCFEKLLSSYREEKKEEEA